MQQQAQAQPIQSEVVAFEALPDSGLVRLPTVMSLFGVSQATVFRYSKSGRLPAPVRLSPRVVAWRVGDLRKKLAELQSQAA